MKIGNRKLRWNFPLCTCKNFELFPLVYDKKFMSSFGSITTNSLTLLFDVKAFLVNHFVHFKEVREDPNKTYYCTSEKKFPKVKCLKVKPLFTFPDKVYILNLCFVGTSDDMTFTQNNLMHLDYF